ncbi:MAG: hypothetical protein ACOC0J_02500, partial [Myxococcota bacterium]
MRHIRWFAPLALVGVLAGCGNGGAELDAETAGAMGEEAGTETAMLNEPVCQPSTGMELEGRTSPYDSTTIALGE